MILTEIRSFIRQKSYLSYFAPAIFRIGFGLVMFFGVLRFMAKGWVTDFYVEPTFHFSFTGFSWVQPWPEWGMWVHFSLMAVAAFCITIGFLYRLVTPVFFLLFTYIELIDKTYYLNHYYAISLIAFLLCFLPLNYAYSVDAYLNPTYLKKGLSNWAIRLIQIQISLIYIGAGIAKWNYDWLVLAQPMTLWMKANYGLPIIGPYLGIWPIPHILSWCGMLYDTLIPFFLLFQPTRVFAFFAVIFFHGLTALFFNIGIFPWVMIAGSIIFFSKAHPEENQFFKFSFREGGLVLFFIIQIVLVTRHWVYPGPFFWTEEGFRFSWNVMIIEKTGMLELQAYDPVTQKRWDIETLNYLTSIQARQMVTQPDMILQFANFVADDFKKKRG